MKRKQDAIDAHLEQWQQEMPKLGAENTAILERLKRCHQLVSPQLDPVFAPFGISPWAFDVLATLRRAGSPWCMSPTALFSELMVTSGTMTTRLRKLEDQGLISRQANQNDARSMLVKLTPKGRTLVEKALVAYVKYNETVLEPLAASKQKQINDALKLLLEALESDEETQG